MEHRGKPVPRLAIDRNVPIPAYQQVVDGVRGAVARGDLARGARLPSVRNLAVTLGLNVNTVARAYRDLERTGVVNTMPGMGTFVAVDGPLRATQPASLRAIPATGAPLPTSSSAPIASTWRDLLAAAHALASAEGIDSAEFVDHAARLAESQGLDVPLLATAFSSGETADLLRALPPDTAGHVDTCPVEDVLERTRHPRLQAILTTFPSLPRVRARLGDKAARVELIPVETELTEQVLRELAGLPAAARIALVTVEKERWDEEANDVMKIIGRHRWLKMVFLDGANNGLAERLEQVDAILHVPRARDAMLRFERPGRAIVELTRQVTSRTRERLRLALTREEG